MIKRFLILLIVLLISLPVYSYELKQGDRLKIVIQGVKNFSDIPFVIQADGTLSLPYIGEIRASGLTMEEFNKIISEKYNVVFNNPEILSIIIEKAPISVGVMAFSQDGGELVSLPQGSTVVEALAAGGVNLRKASLGRVKIIRADGTVVKINVNKLIKTGDPVLRKSAILNTGDIVYVPKKFFYLDLQTTVQIVSLVSSLIVIFKYFSVE